MEAKQVASSPHIAEHFLTILIRTFLLIKLLINLSDKLVLRINSAKTDKDFHTEERKYFTGKTFLIKVVKPRSTPPCENVLIM